MSEPMKKDYVDETLGFPVSVRNMPVKNFRGEWTPDIDPDRFAQRVLWKLVMADRALTGHQVRFIRHWLDETLQAFAQPLDVSPPAVSKWENKSDNPTGMAKGTELHIRMRIVERLQTVEDHPEDLIFTDVFNHIADFDPNTPVERIKLDWNAGFPPRRKLTLASKTGRDAS